MNNSLESQQGLLADSSRLVVEPKAIPRFSLAELLAEAEAAGAYVLPAIDRQWLDTPAVGGELL